MVANSWITKMFDKIDKICLKEISSQLANDNLRDWIYKWQTDFKRIVREVNTCYEVRDGWIKLTDNLPNEEDPVQLLVYYDKGDYASVYATFGWRIAASREQCFGEKNIWISNNELITDKVVGWKPMSEPLNVRDLKELGFLQ